eukprot:SAG22_NODE_1046_length_5865_cov_4.719910_4_plen_111_part_00
MLPLPFDLRPRLSMRFRSDSVLRALFANCAKPVPEPAAAADAAAGGDAGGGADDGAAAAAAAAAGGGATAGAAEEPAYFIAPPHKLPPELPVLIKRQDGRVLLHKKLAGA